MENVTLRIPTALLEELDAEADDAGVSRSEYIRENLDNRHAGVSAHEHAALQAEYDELQTEYEQLQREHERLAERVQTLETDKDRLQDQLAATNRRVDEHQELVAFAEEQRELERYREARERRKDEANLFTRLRWKITGMPADLDGRAD